MEYVRNEDRTEYRNFSLHQVKQLGRAVPEELWHYTTAEGLIGILITGCLWATQVTCLNDTLEQRYFGDLVHERVKQKRASNADPILDVLYRVADDFLPKRDFSATGQFVVCFSENEDDL